MTRRAALLMGLAAPAIISSRALAKGNYDVGADDSEIRIGQTAPYSGPASYLGVTARAETAYFERLNRNGGINGRKVKLLSLDDAYSPPKTVEATRRLVESENVLGMMGSVGTASQARWTTPTARPRRWRPPAGSWSPRTCSA
ncbi:ABC transporter substrate-binding protein [Camelimonas abortus]